MILRLVDLREQRWFLPTLWSEEIIIRFSFPMVINRATITSILLTKKQKQKEHTKLHLLEQRSKDTPVRP